MTMHDPFVGMGYGWGRRARWLGGRRPRGLPREPGAPVRAPYRRKLARIERSLMSDTPALCAKFAIFNHLTGEERPAGAERLSPPASTLRRPRAAHLAVLLALAAVVTMCVMLSAHVRTVVRPCPTSAGTGTSAPTPLRGVSCAAYANTK